MRDFSQTTSMRPTELMEKIRKKIIDNSLTNSVSVKGVVIYDKGYYKLSDGTNAITLNTAEELPVGDEIEVKGFVELNLYSTKEYSAIYPALNVNSYNVLFEGDINQKIQQEIAKAIREKEHFGFWEFFSRALEQKEVLIVGLIYGKSAQVGQDFKSAFRSSAGHYCDRVSFVEIESTLSDGELAKAIESAKQKNVDALFLLRGGGSQEELSRIGGIEAIRAVKKANLPFYTAIGHSYDRLSSDMERIADAAFATPSIAGTELGKLVRIFSELKELKTFKNAVVEKLNKVVAQDQKILLTLNEVIKELKTLKSEDAKRLNEVTKEPKKQEGTIYSVLSVILLALIILFVGLILLKLFSHFSLIL